MSNDLLLILLEDRIHLRVVPDLRQELRHLGYQPLDLLLIQLLLHAVCLASAEHNQRLDHENAGPLEVQVVGALHVVLLLDRLEDEVDQGLVDI